MQQSVTSGRQQTVGCSLGRKFAQAGAHSLPKAVYQGCSVIYITHVSYFAEVSSIGSTPAPGLFAVPAAIPATVHHSCIRDCP